MAIPQAGGKQRPHWSLPDPSEATGGDDELLAVYRRVHDAPRSQIEAFVKSENDETGRLMETG